MYFKDNQPVDHRNFWNPAIQIRNKVSEKFSKTWYEVLTINGEAYLVQKSRQIGTFAEPLELHDFPFDSQVRNKKMLSSWTYTPNGSLIRFQGLSNIHIISYFQRSNRTYLSFLCQPSSPFLYNTYITVQLAMAIQCQLPLKKIEKEIRIFDIVRSITLNLIHLPKYCIVSFL